MVVRGSASEYIKQYIPDAPHPLQKPVEIGRDVYARIQGIGPLVLGSNGEVSVFTAVKHLARARPEVKRLLSYSSTAIGKKIDDAVVENPDDPWFDTVLLFRPDVLVDQNGKVYTGELEIVVGGAPIISLLQAYIYGEHRILDGLLAAVGRCVENFGIDGAVAFLFDWHGRSHIGDHTWIPKHYGSHLHVANMRAVDFRRDGVYVRDERLALGYAFVKAYKLDTHTHPKDKQLLRCWLERKLLRVSPPSLVMDNKVIIYLLQEDKYAGFWRQSLGRPRYEALRAYLPKTYLVTEHSLQDDPRLRQLVAAPWNYGRFVLKHAALWGSKMLIVSPRSGQGGEGWSRRVAAMLKATSQFGPLLLQESVDTMRLPASTGSGTVLGRTKFTPFFLYDPFTKACTSVGMSVNIAPSGFRAHLTSQSTFALVEGE